MFLLHWDVYDITNFTCVRFFHLLCLASCMSLRCIQRKRKSQHNNHSDALKIRLCMIVIRSWFLSLELPETLHKMDLTHQNVHLLSMLCIICICFWCKLSYVEKIAVFIFSIYWTFIHSLHLVDNGKADAIY